MSKNSQANSQGRLNLEEVKRWARDGGKEKEEVDSASFERKLLPSPWWMDSKTTCPCVHAPNSFVTMSWQSTFVQGVALPRAVLNTSGHNFALAFTYVEISIAEHDLLPRQCIRYLLFTQRLERALTTIRPSSYDSSWIKNCFRSNEFGSSRFGDHYSCFLQWNRSFSWITKWASWGFCVYRWTQYLYFGHTTMWI